MYKNQPAQAAYEFITIAEFAKRLSVSLKTARRISVSREMRENGIAVKITPYSMNIGGTGGTRINWTLYLQWMQSNSILEYRKSKAEKRAELK